MAWTLGKHRREERRGGYTAGVGRRFVVWIVGAGVALPVYALTNMADLPQGVVLVLTFVGAMIGTIAGRMITERLAGPEPEPLDQPPPPRGRGSGRTEE